MADFNPVTRENVVETKEEDDKAASNTKFSVIVKLFDDLQRSHAKDKRPLLRKFFDHMRTRFPNASMYPFMRLIVPNQDKERTQYKMKEAKIATEYVNYYGLAKEQRGSSGYELLHWREPGTKPKNNAKSFADVVYHTIKNRALVTERHVTVKQLNDWLTELNFDDSLAAKTTFIQRINRECTPEEQKWIIGIVLKTLNIGASEKTVFDSFHPDANQIWQTNSNLLFICNLLRDPKKQTKSSFILFERFTPMLCKRGKIYDIAAIEKDFRRGPYWIETKLDGERMQCHFSRTENRFRWITRSGTDYTHYYGESMQETQKLSSYLAKALPLAVEQIILDGEMLAYNPVLKRIEEFGGLRTAAGADLDRQHDEDVGVQSQSQKTDSYPVYRIFDVISINGEAVTDRPLNKRKAALEYYFHDLMAEDDISARIQLHRHTIVQTSEGILDELTKVMENGLEGIIIKMPQSHYLPGSRGAEWTKLKPDYSDEDGEALDLIIIGASHGRGERSGLYSSFLCAVRQDSESGWPTYLTLCRVGGGFKLENLREMLTWDWVDYNPNNVPNWLDLKGKDFSAKVRPDKLLNPSHRKIISVRCAQVVASDEYSAGYTLRHPRFVNHRPDLDVPFSLHDVMTYTERQKTRSAKMEEQRTKARAKKGKGPRTVLADQDYSAYRMVPVDSDLFQGRNIALLKASVDNVPEIATMIKQNGGNVIPVTGDPNAIIVADKNTIQVQNYRQSKDKKVDIYKSQWIKDCVERQQLVPLEPRYMLLVTEKTQTQFSEVMDDYGDSYTELLTGNDLKKLVQEMTDVKLPDEPRLYKRLKLSHYITDEMLYKYLGEDEFPTTMFNRIVAFCPGHGLEELMLLEYGAEVVEKLTNRVTHIVCEPEQGPHFRQMVAHYDGMARVVSIEWVKQSVANQTYLDAEQFKV